MRYTIVAAAAANEPNPGWGNLLALVFVAAGFWLATKIHQRWQASKNAGPDEPLSPPTGPTPADGVKPQASTPAGPMVIPSQKGPTEVADTLDDLVAARVGRVQPAQIIRTARARFGVSESTAKRAIRRFRARTISTPEENDS